MPELRVEPADLARAAQLSLAEAKAMTAALQSARGVLPLPAAAIGDATAADRVATMHDAAVEEAALTVEHFIGVLEQDVEALYQTAFGFQRADQTSAAGVGRTYPPLY